MCLRRKSDCSHCFSRESPLSPHQMNIRRLQHFSIKPCGTLTLSKLREFRTNFCGRSFSCKCVWCHPLTEIFEVTVIFLFLLMFVLFTLPFLNKSRNKMQMKKRNGGRPVLEMKLFHGTANKYVNAICHSNFDWRICGSHGTAYGKG